ncbi:MAG: 4-phosphopantoate--beta-alanine ligase [Phycisphaerales bacterium]
MKVVTTAESLAAFRGGVFVPTMGALHEGHAALVRRAAELAAPGGLPVVVSVFVNPTQFNDPRDLERYPRTLDADVRVCESALGGTGMSCVFAPPVEVMYPPEMGGRGGVRVPELPAAATVPLLEDAHRPGHFAGVCQVCLRLFELVRPAQAVFGEKDWQQLAVVRAMAAREMPGLEIIGHETVREGDGLAMSSRNTLLMPQDRRRAPAMARALVEAGRHDDPAEAEQAGRRVLLANRLVPEYVAVRDSATLGPPKPGQPARVLAAAKCGNVRLIDNAGWPGFRLETA